MGDAIRLIGDIVDFARAAAMGQSGTDAVNSVNSSQLPGIADIIAYGAEQLVPQITNKDIPEIEVKRYMFTTRSNSWPYYEEYWDITAEYAVNGNDRKLYYVDMNGSEMYNGYDMKREMFK